MERGSVATRMFVAVAALGLVVWALAFVGLATVMGWVR